MTHRRLKNAASAAVLAWTCAFVAQPLTGAGRPPLDFDLLFGDNAAGQRPTGLAWSPAGDTLAFFFDDGEGKALHAWDATSRETSLLVRESEGGVTPLNAFHWAPDGRSLLIESGGDLVSFSLETRSARKLTVTDAAEEDPRFSPTGDRLAFVRDNDLWVLDLETSRETRLTRDGREGSRLNGKTDWVYWEEIWGRRQVGHWWSPDGERIAYYRFDDSEVREYPLLDYTAQYPELTRQRYPKAGETNPEVRIGVVDVESGQSRWLISNTLDDSYLARVDWLPDGTGVAIQRLNREQDHLELLRCPREGGPCSLLHEERSKTWVNLTDHLHFLADGRFLWTTEKSGWNELWLHAADGAPLRELTPDGWTVTGIDGVVTGAGSVVWTGYSTGELGALHRAVFSLALDGGPPMRLSSPQKTAGAAVATASGRTAIVESSADAPHDAFVVDLAGTRLGELPTRPPSGYDPAELASWRFLTLPGDDGAALPAALLAPKDVKPGVTYPVIQYHYGGPASQVVRDSWGTRSRNLWHKMMAERGYGVLLVDNRGSNFFGKSGADRLHRRFGEVNLAAQKAGARYLRESGWADADRIGLWGWSGGGSNTLYCILNSPGTWRAAVSGAPVTDWRFYDTIWTERYLDHPRDNAEGYERSSAVTHAAELADALLLVHGTADDNVHPQNTMVMAAKLIAAGKPFELAIHPGQKHGFRGADSRQFYERMTRFFDRELSE